MRRKCGGQPDSNVVSAPEKVIGQVDAVVIATDDGDDHVRRARALIEAGLPVFVDKPLATNVADLHQFIEWHRAGKIMLSTSGMRYAPEMRLNEDQRAQLGELRWITSVTCKSWSDMGFTLWRRLSRCWASDSSRCRRGRRGGDLMQITHRSGVRLTIAALHDAYGSFGSVHLYGTKASYR